MNSPRKAVLGRRRLSILGENRPRFVTVTITMPERERPEEWCCEVRVSGGGLRIKQRIFGGDALQAVQLALNVVSQQLESSGLRLSWGKPDERAMRSLPDGWTGFVAPLPLFLGPDGAKRNQRVRDFLRREWRDYARATRARVEAEYARLGVPIPVNGREAFEQDPG